MSSNADDATPKLGAFCLLQQQQQASNYPASPFSAPELGANTNANAAAWERADVFSFGAIAQWLHSFPTSAGESVHCALFARCTLADPKQRPSLKELYRVLSQRKCFLCLDDRMLAKACIACPSGEHYLCNSNAENSCYDRYVEDHLTRELGSRREGVTCSLCTNQASFPIQGKHVELALRSQRELMEFKTAQLVAQGVTQRMEEERSMNAVDLALRRLAEELNNKCPQCSTAFVDFSACCAVKCSTCNIQFCAFCMGGASANAHAHVRQCALNPRKGDYFCSEADYARQQRERKVNIVKQFLQGLDARTQAAVRASALAKEYL